VKPSIASWSALCLVLLGCDVGPDYSGVEFEVESAPPDLVSVQPSQITLVAGVAVQVSVKPLSSGRHYDDNDLLALRGGNANMLHVFSTRDDHEFVLVALLAGDTCLDISINSHSKQCIPVHITEPPAD
jgi:hypothetical protein